MLEKLMTNPYAWAVLSILTIVSFIYAIVTQHINAEKKEFSYSRKFHSLIHKKKGKFEKLSISYDGREIEDLCVSRFTIWNSGNKTLSARDMVDSKELTITALDGNRILDVEIVACSEVTNDFRVQVINEHIVRIVYDYVDKKEGVVIQVIHTGTEDSLTIDCKIKGGRPIKNFINETVPRIIRRYTDEYKFDRITVVIAIIMLGLFLVMALVCTFAIFDADLQNILFDYSKAKETQEYEPQRTAITMSIICWLYWLILCGLYIPLAKKKFSIGIPRSIKKYSGFDD